MFKFFRTIDNKIDTKPQLIVKIFLFSVLLSLIYSYSHLFYLNNYFFLTKVTSILLLIIIIKYTNLPDRVFSQLLMAGVLCHGAGDFLIEYYNNIIYCIPFFLMGHLIYFIIILRDINKFYKIKINNNFKYQDLRKIPSSRGLTTGSRLDAAVKPRYDGWVSVSPIYLSCLVSVKSLIKIAVIIFIIYLAVIISSIITYDLSGLTLVIVYTYISLLALLIMSSLLHPKIWYLTMGISLYIISDILIGYDAFVEPIVLRHFFSWPLYYMAQISIIFALLSYHVRLVNNNLYSK